MTTNSNVDLHLLKCFDALVETCSVTLAADRMHMSQPGMSSALARLREIFNDPILIRTAKGMKPTERARELSGDVRLNIEQLSRLLEQPGEFVPAHSRARVRIASTDALIVSALAPTIAEIGKCAPGIQLQLVSLAHVRVNEPLEAGEIDLALGYYPDLPSSLYSRRLLTDPVCCMVGRDSGHGGDMTLDRYAAASHAVMNLSADYRSTLETIIDQELACLGRERRVSLSASSTNVIACLVATSELVATVPSMVVRLHEKTLGIIGLKLPFDVPPVPFSLVWHARTHHNPDIAWVREKLREGIAKMQYLPVAELDGPATNPL